MRTLLRGVQLAHRNHNRTYFCTVGHTQRIKQLRQTFRLHESGLKEGDQFKKQFSDAYLMQLVQNNYCFSDLVDICNGVVFHQSGEKSDAQVTFLAYSFNLYFTQLKRGKEVLLSISKAIEAKIKNKQFELIQPQLEAQYLRNIRSLSNRNNSFLTQEVLTLKNTFVRFLLLKNQLIQQTEKWLPTNGTTLDRFAAIMPYVPRESIGCRYIIKLEKFYISLIRYQVQRFLSNENHSGKETSACFIQLMEIGVMIGKLSGRYINLFEALPTVFSSEAQFAAYLGVIREFFSYQMVSVLDFQQFDNYNRKLFSSNTAYRSPQTLSAFEAYVAALIGLKKSNLRIFSTYLGYNQQQFVEEKGVKSVNDIQQ